MESTGVRDRIQVSQSMANALYKAGMSVWLKPHKDCINKAKGKGVLHTFWLNPSSSSKVHGSSSGSEEAKIHPHTTFSKEITEAEERNSRTNRLVDWMVDILLDHIRKIVSCPRTGKRSISSSG